MRLTSRQSVRRCAYCHDVLVDLHETCAGCQAVYHADCFHLELGDRCGTPGCSSSDLRPRRLLCCGTDRPGVQLLACDGCGDLCHHDCEDYVGGCCGGQLRPVDASDVTWTTDAPTGPEVLEARLQAARKNGSDVGSTLLMLAATPLVVGAMIILEAIEAHDLSMKQGVALFLAAAFGFVGLWVLALVAWLRRR